MIHINKPISIASLSYFPAGLLLFSIILIPQFPSIDYDDKRLLELIFLQIALLIGCFFRFALPYPFNRILQFFLASLMILSIATTFSSANVAYATIEFITFFALIVAIILISKIWHCRQSAVRYAIALLFIAFLLLEIKFYTYYLAFIFSDNHFSAHDFFPSFAHIRYFNQYQLWSLPLLPLVANDPISQRRSYRLLIKFVGISWWLMFFTTGGRGVIVAMVGAALLLLFFFRRFAFDYLKQTLAWALGGFLLYQSLFHAIPYLLHPDTSQLLSSLEIRSGSSGRDILWTKALKLIAEHPLLGVGPMHYAWFDSTGLESIERINHPHNSLLQLASEWGLPALFCILSLWGYAYRQWLKKFNKEAFSNYPLPRQELIIGLSFSAFAASIYSLFSGVIVMPMSQLMSVFIISLMVAVYHEDQSEPNLKKYNLAWLFLPIAVIYPYLLYPDISELLSHKEAIAMDPQELYPRFWLRGNIYYRD